MDDEILKQRINLLQVGDTILCKNTIIKYIPSKIDIIKDDHIVQINRRDRRDSDGNIIEDRPPEENLYEIIHKSDIYLKDHDLCYNIRSRIYLTESEYLNTFNKNKHLKQK